MIKLTVHQDVDTFTSKKSIAAADGLSPPNPEQWWWRRRLNKQLYKEQHHHITTDHHHTRRTSMNQYTYNNEIAEEKTIASIVVVQKMTMDWMDLSWERETENEWTASIHSFRVDWASLLQKLCEPLTPCAHIPKRWPYYLTGTGTRKKILNKSIHKLLKINQFRVTLDTKLLIKFNLAQHGTLYYLCP